LPCHAEGRETALSPDKRNPEDVRELEYYADDEGAAVDLLLPAFGLNLFSA
jgi:hypothetical protein